MPVFTIELNKNTLNDFCAGEQMFSISVCDVHNVELAEVTCTYDEAGNCISAVAYNDTPVEDAELLSTVLEKVNSLYTAEHELIIDIFHDEDLCSEDFEIYPEIEDEAA